MTTSEKARNQIAFGMQPFNAALEAITSIESQRDYILQQFLELVKHAVPEWENLQAIKQMMLAPDRERTIYFSCIKGDLRFDGKLTKPNSGLEFLIENSKEPVVEK